MHFLDFTHIAQAFVLHTALQQASIHAGKTDGFSTLHFQQVDQRFVDLAGKNHLDDVHGFFICHPQTVHKLRLFAEPVHEIVDLRSTAMNQHNAYADKPQQDDVLHDLLLQLVVDHGVAAVFYDDHFTGVTADVRQGGGQDFRTLHVSEVGIHHSTPYDLH